MKSAFLEVNFVMDRALKVAETVSVAFEFVEVNSIRGNVCCCLQLEDWDIR